MYILQFSFFHSDLVRVKTSSITYFLLEFFISHPLAGLKTLDGFPGRNESGAAKSRFSVGKKLGAEGEDN